jgi:hypothetical protein
MDLAAWQSWWKDFGGAELRHLLLLWWDPIGVYGVHEARDEYDGYSGQIARMLREGADASAVAPFLDEVAVQRMGLRRAPDHEAAVADRIIEWYDRAIASADAHRVP